jgi:hypothetical protein
MSARCEFAAAHGADGCSRRAPLRGACCRALFGGGGAAAPPAADGAPVPQPRACPFCDGATALVPPKWRKPAFVESVETPAEEEALAEVRARAEVRERSDAFIFPFLSRSHAPILPPRVRRRQPGGMYRLDDFSAAATVRACAAGHLVAAWMREVVLGSDDDDDDDDDDDEDYGYAPPHDAEDAWEGCGCAQCRARWWRGVDYGFDPHGPAYDPDAQGYVYDDEGEEGE